MDKILQPPSISILSTGVAGLVFIGVLICAIDLGLPCYQAWQVEQTFDSGMNAFEENNIGEAEHLWTRCLREQVVLDKHYARVAAWLATCLERRNDNESALALLKKVVAIHKCEFGERHFETGVSIRHLALVHKALGHSSEAEALYKSAITIFEDVAGGCDEHVALSMNDLANLYCAQGRYAEARVLMNKSSEICKTKRGEHDEYTRIINRNLVQFNSL